MAQMCSYAEEKKNAPMDAGKCEISSSLQQQQMEFHQLIPNTNFPYLFWYESKFRHNSQNIPNYNSNSNVASLFEPPSPILMPKFENEAFYPYKCKNLTDSYQDSPDLARDQNKTYPPQKGMTHFAQTLQK